jgi:hypothetical protein
MTGKTIFFISLIFFCQSFSINLFGQGSKLQPGFDSVEFTELLKVSSRQGDSLYNKDLPAPEKFTKVYRSPEMGLGNRWDLWVSEDSIACISIRGTTKKQVSWLDNFYAAMAPAKGSLKLNKETEFPYHLSDDPKAAVHTGWLVSTAFLSLDIIPRVDSLYELGFRDFFIMGHSQGGAISYLLTALLLNKQENEIISPFIRFKTYSSAAPKPGNLYFAYDYENKLKGGWAFTVINAADWVPQAPFSIQKIGDFTDLSPFTNAKGTIRKQPFLKRIAMTKVYNSLDKPTVKADKEFQKYLGKKMEKYVKNILPDFESPNYFDSNNYVRTGTQIVLYPNQDYFDKFPQDTSEIWINHMFEAYFFLTDLY